MSAAITVSPDDDVLPRDPSRRSGDKWLTYFICGQLACQLVLLSPLGGAIRVPLRIMSFLLSILFLFLMRAENPRRHPATAPTIAVLFIVAFGMAHPSTNSVPAAVAQVVLYVAVLAPVFWVARMDVTASTVTRVMMLLWIFHTASSILGVLQLMYPGRFMPHVSDTIMSYGDAYLEGLTIELGSGERMLRPLGLTDIPGGAGQSGIYAVLFGVGFFMARRELWLRLAALASMLTGMFCVYVCQVRASFIVLSLSLAAVGVVTLYKRGIKQVLGLSMAVGAAAIVGLTWSVAVGGEAITARLETLAADDPAAVYHQNRGLFLQYTITDLIPQYPLGAGLGRWGMTNSYFGDRNATPDTAQLHCEIQLTGWIYDGGVLLAAVYLAAIIVAMFASFRVACFPNANKTVATWAMILFAYSIGACVMTLSYPLFIGQLGLEFWMFNSLIYAAAVRHGAVAPVPTQRWHAR